MLQAKVGFNAILIHTWNAIFMSPQTPFSLNEGSFLWVKEQSSSTAPPSRILSFEGENSRSKLQSVEDAITKDSTLAPGVARIFIRGSQTPWSWNVVLRSWTDLDNEWRHLIAGIWTLGSGSSRAETTLSMRGSVSIIFLRISSSFAPKLANTLKAALFNCLQLSVRISSFFANLQISFSMNFSLFNYLILIAFDLTWPAGPGTYQELFWLQGRI